MQRSSDLQAPSTPSSPQGGASRFSAAQIAAAIGGQVAGDPEVRVEALEQVSQAQPGQLTFIRDEKFAALWSASGASAAVVSGRVQLEPGPGRALIRVPDADAAMVRLLELFAPPPARPAPGVHPTAIVDPTAQLGAGVSIGAGCVVGARARIGDHCVLHARVTLYDDVALGERSELYPGVVVRERCSLGRRVILHPNVVIGADGFGYTQARSTDPAGPGFVHRKLPHIGTVEIHDDVEIGACSCVDRGKFAATVVGAGTKIDNLVQIGHNVRVGRSCILCGQVGIAGSAQIGDGVMLGGKVAVKDHAVIGAGARVMACAAVMDDIPPGETWGGYPAREARIALREHAAMRKLPDLLKQIGKKSG